MQKWEELVYARDEGKEEGEKVQLIKQICKKLKKGKIPHQIAEELSMIEKICQAAQKYAPDYDCEQLYKEL